MRIAMNNHAFLIKAFHDARWLVFAFILLFLSGCFKHPGRETARSGKMVFAVDNPLSEIAGIEAMMFRNYYPDAEIEILPAAPVKTLGRIFDKSARAALISGDFDSVEDSLFSAMKRKMRKEPVALDAIVCVTGKGNGVDGLSVKDIVAMYYNGGGKGKQNYLLKDDYRLVSVLSVMAGRKKKDIRAWSCSDVDELLKRIASADQAYGLLFRSSLDAARDAGIEMKNIKILPVSDNGPDTSAYLPERDAIFENRYPLVTTVYYVYYPGDALAAGFGSWISGSGQKAFERSSFVPYRLTQRTIILK